MPSHPFFHRAAIAAVLLGAAALTPCFASRSALEKPYLSVDLQEKLSSLPYGISDNRSLFLRYRHVNSIQFFGAGTNSRFSFKRGQSLLNEGLSMRLVQNNKEAWASGTIYLKKPLDVRPYNSVVIWVWPSRPNMRLWVGLKGDAYARSDALPVQSFPPYEPSQLVIPFSRFSPKRKLNWNAIQQIHMEFGEETTGNTPMSALQVLGLAFVQQNPPLKQSMMVLGRANTNVVLAEPMTPFEMEDPDDLVPMAETVIDRSSHGFAEPESPPAFPSEIFYLLFIGTLALSWFLLLLRRRRSAVPPETMGKVLSEIHWPFSVTQPVLHRKVEREFWNGVADQKENFGWLSTTGLVVERSSPVEYFGEPFLRRQIGLAARSGIRLFPSLSFTNALFRKEGFQQNLDRSSSAVRTLAVETLLRFSDVASGARIENAAELLGTKLRRKPRTNKTVSTEDFEEHEFWSDVIGAIKSKKPGFLFIADASGDQSRLIREVGFDFYENNLFVDTLLYQLRVGKVGDARAFLKGESALHLSQSIFNVSPLLRPLPRKDTERHQNVLCALLLALLPGVVQHDNSIPEAMIVFMRRMARSTVIKSGSFALLSSSKPSTLAFARWKKKSLMLAVANFSHTAQDDLVDMRPLMDGFENNKLFLFNNALHGTSTLKNLLNQPPSDGPALALWGQNLRDFGLPLAMPGLSLNLFSVDISKPIASVGSDAAKETVPVPSLSR